MCYIFVDVEWVQKGKTIDYIDDEILQLAAISCNNDFKEIRSFFKIVQPKDIDSIDKNILSLLKLDTTKLTQAKPIEEILKAFAKTFPDYEFLVVWNRDAYCLLQNFMKRYKLDMPIHKAVVLQEILAELGKNVGFEKALKHFNVEYNSSVLHCSKQDVKFLKDLYITVRKQYLWTVRKQNQVRLVTSVNSDIVHKQDCHIASKITEENKIIKDMTAIIKGYKGCKCCMVDMIPDISVLKTPDSKEYYIEDQFCDEAIEKMCEQFGLRCSISEGLVFITSRFSVWRIYHDYEKVQEVYHENLRDKRHGCNKRQRNPGFHKQEVNTTAMYGVLKYISQHDKYFLVRTKRKKDRMQQLFDQIQKERTIREEAM